MKKNFLAVTLAASMLASMAMPAVAFAEETTDTQAV